MGNYPCFVSVYHPRIVCHCSGISWLSTWIFLARSSRRFSCLTHPPIPPSFVQKFFRTVSCFDAPSWTLTSWNDFPYSPFTEWSGINALLYYGPTLVQEIGLKGDTVSLVVSGGIGIVQFIAVLPAIAYIDRVGRKALLRGSCPCFRTIYPPPAACVCFFLFGASGS